MLIRECQSEVKSFTTAWIVGFTLCTHLLAGNTGSFQNLYRFLSSTTGRSMCSEREEWIEELDGDV